MLIDRTLLCPVFQNLETSITKTSLSFDRLEYIAWCDAFKIMLSFVLCSSFVLFCFVFFEREEGRERNISVKRCFKVQSFGPWRQLPAVPSQVAQLVPCCYLFQAPSWSLHVEATGPWAMQLPRPHGCLPPRQESMWGPATASPGGHKKDRWTPYLRLWPMWLLRPHGPRRKQTSAPDKCRSHQWAREREREKSEFLCSPGIVLAWVRDGPGAFSRWPINFPNSGTLPVGPPPNQSFLSPG